MQVSLINIVKEALKYKFVRVEKMENNLSTIKQAGVYLTLTGDVNSLIDSLDLTKKVIAEKININRTNFFRVLRGRQLLTIEQFNSLIKLINKDLNNYYNQIGKVRIGKLTYLPFSREFIDLIIKEKFDSKGDK
jgi:hypothetical protein